MDAATLAATPKRLSQSVQQQQAKKMRTGEDWNLDFFGGLQNEVVLKILSCLSATDLATMACVNRHFSSLASTSSLWHRLYVARWKDREVIHKYKDGCWKLMYIEREGLDTENVLESVTSDVMDDFKEMQRARRSMSLGPCSFEVIAKRPPAEFEAVLPERVKEWLRQHGFDEKEIKEVSSSESADYGPFVEIEDCFVCERTGVVHVCDDRCEADLISSREKACHISGREISIPLFDYEDLIKDDSEEEEWEFNGHLGRAFAAGYNCSDYAEFRRRWDC